MGKAKKEHRKKVAKRNEKLNQQRAAFQKKMAIFQDMIRNGVMKPGTQIINEEQAKAELEITDVEIITETQDEQTETSN